MNRRSFLQCLGLGGLAAKVGVRPMEAVLPVESPEKRVLGKGGYLRMRFPAIEGIKFVHFSLNGEKLVLRREVVQVVPKWVKMLADNCGIDYELLGECDEPDRVKEAKLQRERVSNVLWNEEDL